MPEEKKNDGEPASEGARRKFRRRGMRWWESATIAVSLAAVVVGGYYGLYVTSRADRLNDYHTRSLAASAHVVSEAIEGLKLNVCNTQGDRKKLNLIANFIETPPKRGADENGSDEEKEENDEVDTAAGDGDKKKEPPCEIDSLATLDDGVAIIAFRLGQTELGYVPLDELLGSIFPPSEFDAVLVAKTSGEVLVDANDQSLNIVQVPLTSAPVGENAEPAGSPSDYVTVNEHLIGGKSFKVFAQPLRLPIEMRWAKTVEERKSDTEGFETLNLDKVWVVVGLMESRKFRSDTLAVSPTALLIAFGAAVIALLSLPYLKLRFLGRREALRPHDILVLISAILIGTSITTLAILEVSARVDLERDIENRLDSLARNISTAFQTERACLDRQLRVLTTFRRELGLEDDGTKLLDRTVGNIPLLADYPLMEMAYWIDKDGEQREKWTVKGHSTQLINVESREYFARARDMQLQPQLTNVPDCRFSDEETDGRGEAALEHTYPGHYLQSIRSRTTGAVNTVLSQRLEDCDPLNENGCAPEEPVVATALGNLSSVTNAILPPDFTFVIIKQNGDVVFHHDPTRNLRENFFDELDEDLESRAAVWSRTAKTGLDMSWTDESTAGPFHVRYRDRAYKTKVSQLAGTEWSLIVLYDLTNYRIARAEVLTFALALSLIYTFLLVAAFLVLHVANSRKGRRVRSVYHLLWPSGDSENYYRWSIAVSVALAIIWFLVYTLGGPVTSVIVSALIGVGAFAATFAFFWIAGKRTIVDDSDLESGKSSNELDTRLYAICIVSAVFLMSVFPPAAFFRAANNEIMSLHVMGDQLRWADELRERGNWWYERYRRIEINDASIADMSVLFPRRGDLAGAFDVHTTIGSLVEVGNSSESTNEFRQPIVDFLGPDLLGIVQRSLDIRALAKEENGRWHYDSGRITFNAPGYYSVPAFGTNDDKPRLPVDTPRQSLSITSPMPALALPGPSDGGRWILALLIVAGGGWALFAVTRSVLRLVFLTDLKAPYFLGIADWNDLADCRRALILRGALDGEPKIEGRIHTINGALYDAREAMTILSSVDAKDLIVVDEFHWGLWDSSIATQKLELLERLDSLSCRVVVHSEVNPLHFLTMGAVDFSRGVAPSRADMERWSAVLADFKRCRVIRNKQTAYPSLLSKIQADVAPGTKSREPLIRIAQTRLAEECWASSYLNDLALRIARHPDLADFGGDDGEDLLVKQVLDQAEAYYRMLWSISGTDERMVLYRIATTGFASWRSRELVRRLVHRGLVYLDPEPKLMNESFRQFVLEAETPEVYEQWTADEGASPWARLRTPIIVAVIGVFLFLFATQPQLFNQSLAFATAIAAIVPTLVKLVSLLGASRTE